MKKMDWMVAAGTVAGLAGVLYSAGCEKTAGDCVLLGSCGEAAGGGTSSSSAASTTASSTSSSGTGGMDPVALCDARHYGGASDEAARSVHVDASANILFAGEHTGTFTLGTTVTAQGKDLFVAKVSSAWDAQWLKSFPVSYGAIAYDPSGDVVVAGASGTPVDFGCGIQLNAPDDLYVVKLKAIDGTCMWAKSFSAPGAHVSLAIDAAGQIALVGDGGAGFDFHTTDAGPLVITDGSGGGGRDLFTAMLDSSGNVLFAKAYGGTADDVINAVAFDDAGGIVIAGAFKSDKFQIGVGGNPLMHPGGLDEAFVARIKGATATWILGFPGDGAAQATGVAVVGGVPIVAGHFTKTMNIGGATPLKATGDDLFVLGITPGGLNTKVAWNQTFLGKGAKTIAGFTTNGTDALALTGSLSGDVDFGLGVLNADQGVYFAKLASANGKALASHTFGSKDSLLTAGGVAFDGARIYVAGAFAAPLELGDKMPLQNAGPSGTDLFVARSCVP